MSTRKQLKNLRDANAISLEEGLKELRDKLNLQDKDNIAFIAEAYDIIIKNHNKVKTTNAEIKQKRQIFENCINGDREVISSALSEAPLDSLTYRRSTADKCIIEKNQDVFDQVKKLNNLKHEMNMKQMKIDELKLTLTNLKRQEQSANAIPSALVTDDESEQRVRVLSTRLDKLLLKINSARYVNTTYKRLLAYLEKDSLTLPGRLDDLESYLEYQKSELTNLRNIHQEARKACEGTRSNRSYFEHNVIEEKTTRDKKLTGVRKTLRALQEESESFNISGIKSARRAMNKQGNNEISIEKMSNFKVERKIQKAALSACLGALKDTVGASKVEDISVNLKLQLQRQDALLTEAENLQNSREKLLMNVDKNENLLSEAKYIGAIRVEEAAAPEGILSEKNKMSNTKSHQLKNQLAEIDRLMSKIKYSIDVFYKKSGIDSAVNSREVPWENKLQQIMDHFLKLKSKFNETNVTIIEEFTSKDEANICNLLLADNLRISLPSDDELEPATTSGSNAPSKSKEGEKRTTIFHDDDDALIETSYYSREDVKKLAAEIVNNSQPKKKGKK